MILITEVYFCTAVGRVLQSDLEVGEELLRFAVALGLHNDVGQLVHDDVEGSLGHQWLGEVNLRG